MHSFRKSFAQAADVHVQGAVVAVKIISPYVLDQLLTRKGPSRITSQLEQKLKLLQGKCETFASSTTVYVFRSMISLPIWIVCEASNSISFQQCFDTGDQLQRLKRLDQIIVRSQLEPF